jgi:sporulation-control protein
MLRKWLASIQIGGTKVDTVLEKGKVRQGEMVKGEIRITGGKIPQEIIGATLTLVCEYRYDHKKLLKHPWKQLKIGEIGTILPGEEKVIPFRLEIPQTMPCTFQNHHREGFRSFLKTDLDNDHAIYPIDTDEITILPHPDLQLVIDHLKKWGIAMTKMSGPMVQFGRFEPIFPYHQHLTFTVANPFPLDFSLTYKGEGEIVWDRGRGNVLSFQVKPEDHADGGNRLSSFFRSELSFPEQELVLAVLKRLDIHPIEPSNTRFAIPETERTSCSEITVDYLWKKTFRLELDRKGKGWQALVDDMLDPDEIRFEFTVTKQDMEDGGKRLEEQIRQAFAKLWEKRRKSGKVQ